MRSRCNSTIIVLFLPLILYLSIQVCFVLHLTCGDYTVTVDLETYQNPTHRSAHNLNCCDGGCTPCDNRFNFCYSENVTQLHVGHSPQDLLQDVEIECQLVSGLVELNNDNIVFPESGIFGKTVENPLEIRGDVWPVRTISPIIH